MSYLAELAFRWYTPWGATGAADGAGAGPGSEGGEGRPRGAAQHQSVAPPNFIFGNPGASK